MDRRLIDGRRFPYFVVEDEFIDRGHAARMGAVAWMVFCVILRHATRDGSSPPSITDMERETGMARSTVIVACQRLRRLGYVSHKVRPGGRGGRVSVYSVVDLASLSGSPADGPRSNKRGPADEPPVVRETDYGSPGIEPPVVRETDQSSPAAGPQNAVPPTTPLSRELNGTKKQQQQERTADAAAVVERPNADAASPLAGPCEPRGHAYDHQSQEWPARHTAAAVMPGSDPAGCAAVATPGGVAERGTPHRQTDADRAMDLLVLEGIDQAAAAALVAGRGENALAAVEAAIRRADQDQPRNRAGWLVTAIRDGWAGLPPVRAANVEDPDAKRAKAVAEQERRNAARRREREAIEAQEREVLEWVSSLPADEHARLLAIAREAYPMAKGDFTSSPTLRGWAVKQGLLTGRKV